MQINQISAFLAIGFVTSGTAVLILTPIAAFAGVITPALQGIMSKAVGDDQQGELQGALASAHALAMVVSPMLMTGIFAAFTREGAPVYQPGAPFVFSAILKVVGVLIFIRASRALRSDGSRASAG